MLCAFRLFGDFVWPPAPGAKDLGNARKTGVVEIYFAAADPTGAKPGQLRAFLRWRPGQVKLNVADAPPVLPPLDRNIFDVDKVKAADWFASEAEGDKEVMVWIHGYDGKKGEERLAFRGAFMFEQSTTGADRLRWPLVRSCDYGKNVDGILSELIVGQPKGDKKHAKDNFRFNLQLPTLFPHTQIGKAPAVPVFSFSALFDSDVAQLSLATDFDTLTVGPAGNTYIVPSKGLPDSKKLGKFGFAPANSPPSYNFVGLESIDISDKKNSGIDQFWPKAENSAIYLSLLRAIGIDTGQDDMASKVKLPSVPAHSTAAGFPGPERISFKASDDSKFVSRLSFTAPAGSGKAGQVEWRNSTFYLHLPEELGGYLKARSLNLDCIFRFEIADEAIWTRSAWSAEVTLRPHWQSDLAGGVSLGDQPPEIDAKTGFPAFEVGTLAAAAYAMREASADLYRVESSQPQSLLPHLTVSSDQKPRLALYAPRIKAWFNGNGLVDFARKPPSTLATPLRASLLDGNYLVGAEASQLPLQLEARFPGFFTSAPKPLTLYLKHDKDWVRSNWQSVTEAESEPHFASFVIDVFDEKDNAPRISWTGRLSSIEFVANEASFKSTDKNPAGRLRTGGRGLDNRGLYDVPVVKPLDYPVAASFELLLPFTSATPVGVDQRRGESGRAAPLLIPLGVDADGQGIDTHFFLAITESLAQVADRNLHAEILEDTTEGREQRTYVVLSEEPFAINRFSNHVLAARGDAGSASVASYDSATRVWELKQVSQYYHYEFPPQVVGESADKPQRLEIHDLKDDVHPGAGVPALLPPPLPYPAPSDGDRPGLKRRPVEFRLSPSADVWIRPSDVERGYFMPEWNSHEIFRQRGELGLGAALAFLRAEFLYGMPVGIDVGKERGHSRRARVAEIETLTGRPLGPAGSGSELGRRWNALARALARRQERLEVWADDPNSVLDFAPARFAEGVSFSLRETALLRAPVTRDGEPGPVENDATYDEKPKQTGSLRYHPQGLSGGALWPVESANLFNALASSPLSIGGEIESVALSPLGGDAAQKAQFLDGKVTIISRTRNGFVECQQVEVLGRIGCLWHRAKHVVVYERTVNPSAQFAPLREEDEEGTRTRRPVLRKVREYIELMQHERSYPDFAQANVRSAGFLDRVRFNGRIINVDSAWSRDVGSDGWEIPLWNRYAARQRPQVYPMPDVAFCSLAEGEGERPTVAQECRDPDYLYFFADFSKDSGADTDAWRVRSGIDYSNVPAASVIAEVHDIRSANPDQVPGGEKRRPPVSRILPGLRRFTWRLVPAGQKVAINAGRAGKPLYVGLDSISFMRAGQNDAEAGAKTFEKFKNALGASAKITAAPAIDELGYWGKDGPGDGSLKQEFSDAVKAVRKLDPDAKLDPNAVVKLKDWWDANKDALATEIKGELGGALNEAEAAFDGFKNGDSIIAKGRASCDRLREDAVGVIQRKAMLIESLLRDWEAEGDKILSNKLPANKEAALDALVKEIHKAIQPAFDNLAGGVADVGESVEKSRAILLDLSAEVDAAIARTLTRVKAYAAAYEKDKPWSDARRREAYKGLFATAEGVADDLLSEIDECRQRLGTELDEATQQIAGHLSKALQLLAVEKKTALGEIASFRGTIEKVLGSAKSAINPFAPKALGGGGVLDDAITTKLPDIIAKIDNANVGEDVKVRLRKTITDFAAAARTLETLAGDAMSLIGKASTFSIELDSQLTSQIAELVGSLENLVGVLSLQVNALNKLVDDSADAALADAKAALADLVQLLVPVLEQSEVWTKRFGDVVGEPLDAVAEALVANLSAFAGELRAGFADLSNIVDQVGGDIFDALKGVQQALSPGGLLEGVVIPHIVKPTLADLLAPMPDVFADAEKARQEIRLRLATVSASIAEAARSLENGATNALDYVSTACGALFEGAEAAHSYLKEIAEGANAYIDKQIDDAVGYVEELVGFNEDQVNELLTAAGALDQTIRGIQNDLSRSLETAGAYGSRVLDASGKLDEGGLMAAPSNILKLYSAVTSAPEIAALKADIDRLRSGFDDLSDIIKTTRADALFDRLGDELKAIGLSLPFDSIGDRLLPVDLSSFDIGKVFRNFGGMRLDKLFKGYRLPQGVRDSIRLTHDFDKKQARAWVQVDIDAPMPGRRSLFSVGVFKADFVDMRLTGQLRFEVSKDNDKVTQTGHGRIGTTVDLVVGGQSMVKFEKFGLNFARETGLDVEFDPKNIRINPAFKFIQDFLSTLFPDEIGGMTVLKRDGIPVGLEHEFSIPPISLNFGTSGVTNIGIGNRFQLIAYPDFVLADRFNVSRPERPFIFSIFIIGGTGYIQLDAEYRPFDNELSVAVEAAAGGSASLAFAFGPFSGQVFITLSVSITYRKVIGRSGGGLSIGVVLVIAGYVNVAGLVTIGIYLMLRMTYRDNGQIDADGTLSVTIRISRFFKITARANVKYKLRGGKSETKVTTNVDAGPTGELAAAQKKISDGAKKLQDARG